MKGLEIISYHCREIYVGVKQVGATTKITPLKTRMFATERGGGHKTFKNLQKCLLYS